MLFTQCRAMKKVSERDVCRFYAKRKRIKRFCYLIKWHGKSMLTLTFTDGNRVCRKSHHANATTAICIFVSSFSRIANFCYLVHLPRSKDEHSMT